MSKEKKADFTLKKIAPVWFSDFQSLNPWPHLQKKIGKNPAPVRLSDFQSLKVWGPKSLKSLKANFQFIFN